MNHTQTVSSIEIQINLKNQSFHRLLIEAMDQALAKLGAQTKHRLFSLLETDHELSKKDIPDKIEDFVNALEQIFGTSALLIEIDIMKSIQQKVPSFILTMEDTDLNFLCYLHSLKSFTDTR